MLKGKTKSGFSYSIPESRVDNMELMDALVGVDKGNPLDASVALDLLLGKEQKKALYDHLRTDDGTVPVKSVVEVLLEILQSEPTGKNS